MQLDWTIGDVIRKLREQKRWNQQKLADVSGLNKGTVVAVEANANVKRETLEAVARGLGMTMATLYTLIPTREQESVQLPAVAGETFRNGGDRRQVNAGPPAGLSDRRR